MGSIWKDSSNLENSRRNVCVLFDFYFSAAYISNNHQNCIINILWPIYKWNAATQWKQKIQNTFSGKNGIKTDIKNIEEWKWYAPFSTERCQKGWLLQTDETHVVKHKHQSLPKNSNTQTRMTHYAHATGFITVTKLVQKPWIQNNCWLSFSENDKITTWLIYFKRTSTHFSKCFHFYG